MQRCKDAKILAAEFHFPQGESSKPVFPSPSSWPLRLGVLALTAVFRMKDIFQRRKSGDTGWGETVSAPRLALAAFGKHPGWDDHLPGIGIETETLALVKQALYVSGIGGQIDSGAWEKLEPEKRLAGYDHSFLWLRPGHVNLGRLWSSTDGKGRAKYPMVLCIDGEAMVPGFMLTHLLPGLERLREACQATTSADQVTKDCRAAQEQLRATLGGAEPRSVQTPVSADARRRFLERRELGPDRLGFLRVLHELGMGPNVRSHHLRLPLADDSRAESLSLWGAFFRCAVPEPVPLLLISRAGVNWLDVIIGEPGGEDFFCLQASIAAVPLTTDVPYELVPDLKSRYQALEAAFLNVPATLPVAVPAPAAKAEAPLPAPVAPVKPQPARAQGKRISPLFVVGGVILLIAAVAIWFWAAGRDGAKAKVPVVSAPENPVPSSATLEQDYRDALALAQRAWKTTNLDQVIAQAQLALKAKPGDAEAGGLLQQAKQIKTEQEKAVAYQATMDAARADFQRKDFVAAIARADAALVIKSDDAAAAELRARARQELDLAEQAKARQQQFQKAMAEGQGAFDGKNYAIAIEKADAALAIQTNAPAAVKLKAEASKQLDLAKLAEVLRVARSYFEQGEYVKAIKVCDFHAAVAEFDSLAKSNRTEQLDLKDFNAKFINGDYSLIESLKAKSYGRKPPFADLQAKAATENAVLEELTALKRATNRPAVKAKLGNAAFRDKPPFKALTAWAETPPPPSNVPPKPTVEKLVSDFEVMLVRFDLLSPAKAQSSAAQKETAISGQLDIDYKEKCGNDAQHLEDQLKQGGWLNADREKDMKKLKDAINYHP